MADRTYLISMCPPELLPGIGDTVIVQREDDPTDEHGPVLLIRLHDGRKMSCIHVSTPPGPLNALEFILLEPDVASGDVGDVRAMRRTPEFIAGLAPDIQGFIRDGRMPEDVVVTVRADEKPSRA